MKTIIMLGVLAMPPLTGTNASGCQQGCTEYQGSCACDQKPADSGANQDIQPSDEKPPRSGLPANQREDVQAVTPQPCSIEHKCTDQLAIDAAKAGKSAAGVPQ